MKAITIVALILVTLVTSKEAEDEISTPNDSCAASTDRIQFPTETIILNRTTFHDTMDNSIMIVGFHGAVDTPGWLATHSALDGLAQRINTTFSTNMSETIFARIVVASLSEESAPRLYRQYAQTTNNKDKIFIYMFLPHTPDIPLKIAWDEQAASSFAVVQELKALEYRLDVFDQLQIEFETRIVQKETLKPLIKKAQQLLEDMENPIFTVRGMKYLRIMNNVESRGLSWLTKQQDMHTLALSAGRCGSKAKCIKGWQNQQLLTHFAGNMLDDARAVEEEIEGGKLTLLHAKYDIPTPGLMLNLSTSELLLLSHTLETREDDLETAFNEKGEDIVDQMREMGNIAPAISRQRLREAYLRSQRGQNEKINGRYFVEYGEMVHKYLYTKRMQTRINHLYSRAEIRERGERAKDIVASSMKKQERGPLM